MPPCSASARWPCAFSVSTSVSTSRRVRQNTSADGRILHVEHAVERRRLVGARRRCRRPGARAAACRRRSSRARSSPAPGSSGGAARSPGSAPASSPRTAPSAASSGVASRIASRSSAKPMSSISSASSRTSMRRCVELQRPAADVIERAARRGDDDVGAALERADLLLHRRAAVDAAARVTPTPLRVLVDRLGDLHRQLARRHEHEAAGLRARVGLAARAAAASAARRRRSCRCRSPPARAGRCRRAAGGWSRAEPASALRSRARRPRRSARRSVPVRRIRPPRRRLSSNSYPSIIRHLERQKSHAAIASTG